MDVKAFKESQAQEHPPAGLSGPLTALWHAAKGEWAKAHDIVQNDASKDAAWVHAYLHRVEGDHDNAGYWYDRASRSVTDMSLDEEAQTIASVLIGRR